MTISNVSFNVRFDLTGAPKLVLTDTTGSAPAGMVGIYTITQPDGYVRTGNISSPDTVAGGVFQYNLSPDSIGGPQCGNYTIKLTVTAPGYFSTDFTRTFAFSYAPVSLSLTKNFDIFTPNLSYSDGTSYSVAGYSTGAVTRSWLSNSTPTGNLTSSGVSINLAYQGQYYDAVYTTTLTSSLVYQHTTNAWLSVAESLAKTEVASACTPKPLDELVQMLESFRNGDIDCAGETPDFDRAQILYTHLIDMLRLLLAGGIGQPGVLKVYDDFLFLVRGNQTVPCNHTNQPIPAYDFSDYEVTPFTADAAYCATFGDNVNISYLINHQLNDVCVLAQVYEVATGQQVFADLVVVDPDNVYVTLLSVPTTNQYRIVVHTGLKGLQGPPGPGFPTGGTTGQYLKKQSNANFDTIWFTPEFVTSLTGEATGTGPGATAVTLSNSAVINKVLTGLSVSSGVITQTDSILTAFGKLQGTVSSLVGGVKYAGTWNAATNSPAITSSVGVQGTYYVVSTPGSTSINGITDWKMGDWIIFNGTVWEKVDNTDAVISVNGQTGAVSLTTTNIAEGTNLYYTDARARAAISLTTTGNSGAATYVNGVLNIPQYQAALTNPITGTGTINYVPKFTASGTIGNSIIQDNGTDVGIGSNSAGARLEILRTATGGAVNNTTGSVFGSMHASGGGPSAYGFAIRHNASAFAGISGSNFVAQLISASANANAFEIYTTGSSPLVFGTNALERMRLTAAGRLLIGTTTEGTNTVDIAGTLRSTQDAFFATSSGNVGIGVANAGTKLEVSASAITPATVSTYAVSLGNSTRQIMSLGTDADYGYIQTWGGRKLYLNNQGNDIVTNANLGVRTLSPAYTLDVAGTLRSTQGANFATTSGNVGIGNADPQAKLHISHTNAGGTAFLRLQTTNTTQGNASIRWQGSAGTDQAFIGSYFSIPDIGNLEFGNGSTSHMQLSSTGNLGINLSGVGGSERLDVNGRIRVRTIDNNASPTFFLTSDANGVVQKSTYAPTGGSGTINTVPLWTSSTALGNSQIVDNGSAGVNVGTKLTLRTDGPFATAGNISSGTNSMAIGSTGGGLLFFANNVGVGTFLSNGDFGIGKSPTTKLDVNGNALMGGSFLANNSPFITGTNISATTNMAIGTSSGVLQMFSGNAERMRLTAAGRLLVGTTTEGTNTVDIAGTLRSTQGANFATSSGSVGIGTESPQARFHSLTSTGTAVTLGDGTSNLAIIQGASRTGTTAVSGSFANTLVLASHDDAISANTGASIGFHGKWNSGLYSSSAQFASIFGGKENSTDANLAGYLGFNTRPAGGNPTERMRITSGGNVGIGTTNPQQRLHINAGAASGSGAVYPLRVSGGNMISANDASGIQFIQRNSENDYGGYIRLLNSGGTPGFLNPRLEFGVQNTDTNAFSDVVTRMVIQAGGSVGIGTTSPISRLHVDGPSQVYFTQSSQDNALNEKNWMWQTGIAVGAGVYRLRAVNDAFTDGQNAYVVTRSGFAVQTHQWLTANTERMRLTAAGALGVGVIPSAWQTVAGVQLGTAGSFTSHRFSSGNNQTFMTNNLYYDNTGFKAINSDPVAMFRMVNNQFRWELGSTTSADALASLTQAMTLTSSGRLLVGTTTEGTNTVDIAGTLRSTQGANFATSSGVVRVGTESGASKLTVSGSGTLVGQFTNTDATNGFGVAIESEGTASSRYALILRNIAGTTVYGGVSTATGQVGHWGLGVSPATTLANMLTVSGGASIGASYTGNAAPSNGLLVQGNVGIGTTSPDSRLSVTGDGTGIVRIGGGAGGNTASIGLTGSISLTNYTLSGDTGNGNVDINRPTNGSIGFRMNNTSQMVLTPNGDLLIGTTTDSNGTKAIIINNGTAPTNNVTDSAQLYAADQAAGNSCLHTRTENGAVIKLYQETTGVGSATVSSPGGGNTIKTDDTFDGYTIQQIAKALRNQGLLA